tara:strand:- start:2572 stop:3546 length:975 start_codon:yes stop_codon:yes gene_type:complete
MADEAMTVIDAGKTIAGLMTGQTKTEEAPAEPVQENETTEEVVEQPIEDNIPAEDIEPIEVAEEATDEAEQDINESSEQPLYRVKVQGDELEVTLDELLQGYQREADYTRSKQDLSLEKSRYNDLLQESQTEINQKLTKLNELTQSAQVELNNEYSNIDFEKLYEDDPVEASRLEHKMRKRAENLNRINQETLQAQTVELRKYVEAQEKKIVRLIPEFADVNKAKTLKNDMKNYLSGVGFNSQEIDTVYDHRQVLLIRDALAYDKIRKANPRVKKQVVNAPRVVKSGAAKTKADVNARLKADKLNRLKKTGAAKDAASIFKDYL